jgi:hypothetical protein
VTHQFPGRRISGIIMAMLAVASMPGAGSFALTDRHLHRSIER